MKGKKVIIAISGSIAAYKIPLLVRLLVKAGAAVRVAMTNAAKDFVTPLTLSTVSGHPVISDVSDGVVWNNHVEMGLWADVLVVAPCSANTLAKMANGICDNMVQAVYLSARCPVYVAPAMDEDMWRHPSTKRNLETLLGFGNKIIPVGNGSLASGLVGEGRMAEPQEIFDVLDTHFNANKPLKGKKALVTAGPTYEKIDPVRFIGNYSTGKMGFAIAEALAEQGADVTLVTGPTQLKTSHSGVTTIHIESAQQLFEASSQHFPDCSIAVLAAAVADYRPKQTANEKIKKKDAGLTIELESTIDTLKELGKIKHGKQTLVGFALETNNEIENAGDKLKRKNADAIVLNSLKDEGAGFGTDTNKVTILNKSGMKLELPLLSKKETAGKIVEYIIQLNNER